MEWVVIELGLIERDKYTSRYKLTEHGEGVRRTLQPKESEAK